MAQVLFTFEELSNYDRVRTPHNMLEEDTEIFLHHDALTREFTCVICLEVLKKTMTSKRCLHRFCYDCITTSLRVGNKECPTCRAKLTSKRDLREDHTMDSLIEKLFPKPTQQGQIKHKAQILQEIEPHENNSPGPSSQKMQTDKVISEKVIEHKRKLIKKNKCTKKEKANENCRLTGKENVELQEKQSTKPKKQKDEIIPFHNHSKQSTEERRKKNIKTKSNKSDKNGKFQKQKEELITEENVLFKKISTLRRSTRNLQLSF